MQKEAFDFLAHFVMTGTPDIIRNILNLIQLNHTFGIQIANQFFTLK